MIEISITLGLINMILCMLIYVKIERMNRKPIEEEIVEMLVGDLLKPKKRKSL